MAELEPEMVECAGCGGEVAQLEAGMVNERPWCSEECRTAHEKPDRWEEARSEILEIDHLRGELRKVMAHSGKLTDALRQCRKRLKQVAKPAYETRREALLEAADELGRQIVDVYTCETQWAERLALDFAQRSVRRMAEEATE